MPLASVALLCLVVAVSDGDTLKARCDDQSPLDEPMIVRLAGIDAPESNQAFGRRAKQALARLTLGKQAQLQCHVKHDRYGRSLCKVMVAPASCSQEPCARTLDAGLAIITLGLAWWEPRYADEQTPQERGQYDFGQYEAKARHAGLWRDADPVPPWEWRREHPIRPYAGSSPYRSNPPSLPPN
ncbi:thermonuclease family protein [Variovorax sp. J22R133]|uniref:thermonuclease family protein n=1 Tax=Variovorax brevis TaxID=3053503 RepID=UPI0025774BE9|nr:thermonuclease family protein [Variovorax sp. J22R133]MDM0115933.1 thermonuclease family protein [Variovorax sp. J22R133]